MALVRGRRVRDAGMGRLVQQSPAAGAHRQHPAGRSRGTLLRYARRAGHGSVTQTKMPPAIPARFNPVFSQARSTITKLGLPQKSPKFLNFKISDGRNLFGRAICFRHITTVLREGGAKVTTAASGT